MENTQPTETLYHSNWFVKFIECLFAAVAVTNTLAIAFEFLPERILIELGESFFNWSLIVEVALAVLFAVGYSIYWHRKEKRHTIKSDVRHAWFRGVLRYWLAFDIATYGFAKILKTQFAQSFHRDDSLVGSLNGFNLTWNYFAHSYTMAVIIALCQIIGSILLLFRKTTLLAVALLLPVMVNIVLINVFYDIATGAFLNSVLFTLGLIYLLVLRWADLKVVFLHPNSHLPAVGKTWFRYALKVLSILAAFGMIYYYVSSTEKCNLVGKWKIDYLTHNGDTVKADAWLKDSTAWTTLYIENRGLLFCPNPYLFDNKRSEWTGYKYDSAKHIMHLFFWNKDDTPADTVNATVSNYNGKQMQWEAIRKKDTMHFAFTKVK